MNTTPLSHLLSQKNPAVTRVAPSTTVDEAVRVMNQFRIGAVLVVDAGGRLTGIFTERDVLSRVVGRGVDPKTTTVQAVMTTKLFTAMPATTLDEAMELFLERRIRHLPVIDHGEIAGMISIGHINRCLLEQNRQEARHLREYINGGVPSIA